MTSEAIAFIVGMAIGLVCGYVIGVFADRRRAWDQAEILQEQHRQIAHLRKECARYKRIAGRYMLLASVHERQN